jgi:hypothetical protein
VAKSPTAVVPTCPDCGGLLHAMRAERLTSAEVASDDGTDVMVLCQCLLCGYEELRPADEAPGESALA